MEFCYRGIGKRRKYLLQLAAQTYHSVPSNNRISSCWLPKDLPNVLYWSHWISCIIQICRLLFIFAKMLKHLRVPNHWLESTWISNISLNLLQLRKLLDYWLRHFCRSNHYIQSQGNWWAISGPNQWRDDHKYHSDWIDSNDNEQRLRYCWAVGILIDSGSRFIRKIHI